MARGEFAACVNVPTPFPVNVETGLEFPFTTTKSKIPSPLKSPTATAEGPLSTWIGDEGASINETFGGNVAFTVKNSVKANVRIVVIRFIAAVLSLAARQSNHVIEKFPIQKSSPLAR